MSFPLEAPDRDEQARALRDILFWFWHEVGHFVAAIDRGQLWWAAGQVEALRHHVVNLVRIGQGVAANDEPYWKLDLEISTEPLETLRSTYVPLERDAILKAGREVVSFFRDRAPDIARANGLTYPSDLAELVSGQLDRVD